MEQRPSSWLAGMALGLAAAAALLYRGDDTLHAAYALAFCTGLVPALEMTLFGLRAVLLTSIEVWREWHPLVEPAVVTPPPPPVEQGDGVDDDAERAWRLALERFFRAGDSAGGFSIRRLEGVVGSDVWGRLTEFYCSDTGGRVLRMAPGDVGTIWGHGWQLDRVLQLLATRRLPHPDGSAPEVQPYVVHATPRNTARQRKTPVIIDGKLSGGNSS